MSKLLILSLTMIALSGCNADEPYVLVKEQRFYVEIAANDASRSQGLMFRDELARNRGMLFIFPDQRMRAFWMRNTRIPLDIIYIDREFKVVSISANTPPCRSASNRCPSYPSAGPAQYVLEINAGLAAELGLEPGDRIEANMIDIHRQSPQR